MTRLDKVSNKYTGGSLGVAGVPAGKMREYILRRYGEKTGKR